MTKFLVYIIFFLLGPVMVIGQGSGVISLSDGSILFQIKENRLIDSTGEVVYSIKGNMIFSGNSGSNENILYLTNSKDIFSREDGMIYNHNMATVYYNLRKGRFYLGNGRFEENNVMNFTKTGSKISIEDGQTGKLIATVEDKNLSNTELIAVFTAITNHFKVDESIRKKTSASEYKIDDRLKGTIKPYWSTGYHNDWEWDGRILKPAWGNRPEDEWVFDGKYLRPYWGTGVNEEWVWDGQFLKPSWQEIPELTFRWDGETIAPYWNYTPEREWRIEQGVAKPKWSNDLKREWVIEGELPIPVIAIIVLGIADR